jgi:hypothetical protein
MFWNVLQIAGVDHGPVRGPSVLHQVHRVVQDGHDAHLTDRDEVESIGIHNALHLNLTHLS